MYDEIDNFNGVSALFRHLVTSISDYTDKKRISRNIDVRPMRILLFRQPIIATDHHFGILVKCHYSDKIR